MSTAKTPRVTGHLKLIERREGPVWYARTRVPGRAPEQTTRRLAPAHLTGGKPRTGQLTRKQAEDALADLLTAERRAVGHGAYDHQPDGATFADAAAGYLHHVEHVKRREFATIKDYRLSISRYLEPRWGERPVASIQPADVERLRDDLMAAGLSARSVVRHLTVAHGVFKYAARAHGLLRNPASADLVDRPTVRYSGDFDTYDATELAALARHAVDAQDATLYLAAAMTGLRQGELLALRWRDIDFARQRVHVRRAWSQAGRHEKAPKSGKVRSVPLVRELVGPFDRLSRREHFTGDDDLIFCDRVGERLDAWALRRRYYAAHRARRTAPAALPRSAPRLRLDRRAGVPDLRRPGDVRPRARHDHRALHPPPPGRRRRRQALGGVPRRFRVPVCVPKRRHRAQISATQRSGFG